MYACTNNLKDTALKLLEHNCNALYRNKNGETALHYANKNKMTEVIDKIKSLGNPQL